MDESLEYVAHLIFKLVNYSKNSNYEMKEN